MVTACYDNCYHLKWIWIWMAVHQGTHIVYMYVVSSLTSFYSLSTYRIQHVLKQLTNSRILLWFTRLGYACIFESNLRVKHGLGLMT